MSTRSLICIKRGKNKYEAIYCHYDGYLEHNGNILRHYYCDRKKVEDLIKLGNISSLAEDLTPDPDEPHTFENPQKYVTVAYGRDRGETGQESVICTMQELKNWEGIDYIYIFNTENKWLYLNKYGKYERFKSVDSGLEDYDSRESFLGLSLEEMLSFNIDKDFNIKIKYYIDKIWDLVSPHIDKLEIGK